MHIAYTSHHVGYCRTWVQNYPLCCMGCQTLQRFPHMLGLQWPTPILGPHSITPTTNWTSSLVNSHVWGMYPITLPLLTLDVFQRLPAMLHSKASLWYNWVEGIGVYLNIITTRCFLHVHASKGCTRQCGNGAWISAEVTPSIAVTKSIQYFIGN